MVRFGLYKDGYNSILFDDCFTLKTRNNHGQLVEGVLSAQGVFVPLLTKLIIKRSAEVA
jgi:hypothetical protein